MIFTVSIFPKHNYHPQKKATLGGSERKENKQKLWHMKEQLWKLMVLSLFTKINSLSQLVLSRKINDPGAQTQHGVKVNLVQVGDVLNCVFKGHALASHNSACHLGFVHRTRAIDPAPRNTSFGPSDEISAC